jgi:steroid delta-isomerase-like uncharacterized protein
MQATTSTSTGTPTTSAREVALASVAGAIARDPDAVVSSSSPAHVEHVVAVGRFEGPQAVRGFFAEMFAAFPDFDLTIDRVLAEDDATAVQWRARATFCGEPFQGIRATGRRVEIRGVDVFEVRDGRVVRNTVYYDGAEFARQIGLLPPKGSRRDRALLRLFNAGTWLRRLGRRPRSVATG